MFVLFIMRSQMSVVSDNVHKVMAHKGSLLQSLYVHPALAWMSLTAQSRNKPWPAVGKRFASEASNPGMSMYQTIKSHSLLQMSRPMACCIMSMNAGMHCYKAASMPNHWHKYNAQ